MVRLKAVAISTKIGLIFLLINVYFAFLVLLGRRSAIIRFYPAFDNQPQKEKNYDQKGRRQLLRESDN